MISFEIKEICVDDLPETIRVKISVLKQVIEEACELCCSYSENDFLLGVYEKAQTYGKLTRRQAVVLAEILEQYDLSLDGCFFMVKEQ